MTSAAVIRSYLLIVGLYTLAASLIWGVNTLFLLNAGLTILEVFVANAVFTGSMALFEIPTGIVADTAGRRTSFLWSLAILFVGTLGYIGVAETGGSFAGFVAASVVLGLGYTFYSGAVEAWLVDALTATGFEDELDRVFARGSMVSGSAMIVGSIAGGLLGTTGLTVPFVVRAGLLALVFLYALIWMKELGFKPRSMALSAVPHEIGAIARDSIALGWRRPSLRLLILASATQSVFMAWGFHAWQPYFLDLLGDSEAVAVAGVIAALVALASICGSAIVEWVTRYCGRRTTLLLWSAAIQVAAAVGVGLAGSFWLAVVLYLVVMAAAGVMAPVRRAYLHQAIPSEKRATVISFDSLVASVGSMGGQTGLGFIAQARSLGFGYVAGGLFTLAALPFIAGVRRLKEPEDFIRGRASIQGSACPGLPDVAAVDSTRRRTAS